MTRETGSRWLDKAWLQGHSAPRTHPASSRHQGQPERQSFAFTYVRQPWLL